MILLQPLLHELQHEAEKTRKYLQIVPQDKFNWKPHPKSRTLLELAIHIAEIPGWLHYTLEAEELDFATLDYAPPEVTTGELLLKLYDEKMLLGGKALHNTSDEVLLGKWRLRNADYIILDMQRLAVIRDMVLNYIAHHRGQLSVYLRLLNVSLPGIYGPSADEQ